MKNTPFFLAGVSASLVCSVATVSGQTVVQSGAINVTANNQIIQNKYIKVTSGHGINVNGFSGVIIRNCLIEYNQGSNGINFNNSPDISITGCELRCANAPATGPLTSVQSNCIQGANSPRPVIQQVKMTNGSSGIYLLSSDNAYLKNIEGYNFRGPFPRGQLIQFDRCTGGTMEYFSAINDLNVSWVEDNINCFKSHGQIFRYGFLDGNNAPQGVGILWEDQNKADSTLGATDGFGGLIEDVDMVRMGNGATSGADGCRDIVCRRVRVKDNFNQSFQGRGVPSSNALVFSGYGESPAEYGINLKLEQCTTFNLANPTNVFWPAPSFTTVQITNADFTPRTAIKNAFKWSLALPGTPAALVDGGNYRINNVNGSRYLHNTSVNPWNQVQTAPLDTTSIAQRWTLSKVAGSTANYRIKSLLGTDSQLAAVNTVGGNVQTATFNPDWTSIQWTLTPVSGTRYRLASVWTGTYLTGKNLDWAPATNNTLIQNSTTMQWNVVPSN